MKLKKYAIHGAYLTVIVALVTLLVLLRPLSADDVEAKAIGGSKSFVEFGEPGSRQLTFSGTWQIVGEKTAFKTADMYNCREAEGFCTYATATVSGDAISVDTLRVPIREWGSEVVIIEAGGDCRTVTVSVNPKKETATAVVEDKSDRPSTCVLPPLTKPRFQVLMDGLEVAFPQEPTKRR